MTHHIHKLQQLGEGFLPTISNPHARITFSQTGEDVILAHLIYVLLEMNTGFYVDIGCFHPEKYSTTKFLHLAGWRGLNVDANPETIALFNESRPNDINVNVGVGKNEESSLSFYRFAMSAASTFSKEVAEKWQNEKGWELRDIITMPMLPINKILANHLPENQSIEYLNIDAEGLDADIIFSLDFDKYKPKIISIEIHDYEFDIIHLHQNKIVQFLTAKGYKLQAVCFITFIFSYADTL